MDSLDLNEEEKKKKKKDKQSSHRDFSTSIRPLMWYGALLGALPFTAQRLPDDGAEGGSTKVMYKLSPLSFPFFITLVWWWTCLLYGIGVPVEDPLRGKESYTFLATINYLLIPMYICSYFPMWLILWRSSRLTSLFTTVAELDIALPSSGFGTCLAVTVIIAILLVDLVMDCFYDVFIEESGQILPRRLCLAHFDDAGPVYLLLMSTIAGHLAQKFEALNVQVEEALKWRDATKLSHLRHLHHRLRQVAREVDVVFSPITGPTYIRMMMQICLLMLLLDTYPQIRQTDTNFWIFTICILVSALRFIVAHALPDRCLGKAASTVHLLEGHDNHEDDAFSRQVSRWRAELASTRVCLSASGFLELTMPAIWTDAQFMVTIVVVLVQFTRESAVTTTTTVP